MSKANCYKCIYRGSVPGDCHSSCQHPKAGGDMFTQIVAMASGNAARELNIRADSHGVRSGWFYWPANFDPVWLLNCDGFTPTT